MDPKTILTESYMSKLLDAVIYIYIHMLTPPKDQPFSVPKFQNSKKSSQFFWKFQNSKIPKFRNSKIPKNPVNFFGNSKIPKFQNSKIPKTSSQFFGIPIVNSLLEFWNFQKNDWIFSEFWNFGISECWNFGILEFRNFGILEF